MGVQGGYEEQPIAGFAGMSRGVTKNIASRTNTGTDAIEAGLGVVSDGDKTVRIPTDSDTVAAFVGVVHHDMDKASQPVDGVVGIQPDTTGGVVTFGYVYVPVITAVSKDDDVYLVNAATGTDQGKFSNDAGAGATAAIQIPNAKFTASGAGIVEISLGIGG